MREELSTSAAVDQFLASSCNEIRRGRRSQAFLVLTSDVFSLILACRSLFACGPHVRDTLIGRLNDCLCARCRLRTNNFASAVWHRRPLFFDTLSLGAATVRPLWIDFESRAYLRPHVLSHGWRKRGVTSVPLSKLS